MAFAVPGNPKQGLVHWVNGAEADRVQNVHLRQQTTAPQTHDDDCGVIDDDIVQEV